MVGVFFKQLAFVLISTYVISQILAIFLTPIIAYISLPLVPEEEKPGWSDTLAERFTGYVRHSFPHAWIAVPIVVVGFLAGFLLYRNLPATFLPKWDEGNFVVDIALPSGTSLEESTREFKDIGGIIDGVPEVRGWTLRIGTSLGHISEQPNVADFLVTLKKDRKRSIYEVRDDLYGRISTRYPNFLEFDIPMVLEDRLGDILGEESPITVLLYGADPDTLIVWGEKVRDALRDVTDLEEVNLKTTYASPFIWIKLKPDAEALYGINIGALSAEVNSISGVRWSAMSSRGEGVWEAGDHGSPDRIDRVFTEILLVYSPKTGRQIPLRYAADMGITENVPEITHTDLSPVSVVSVRFKGNDMTLAVKRVRSVLAKLDIPRDITPEIAGFYREQQNSFREMAFVVGYPFDHVHRASVSIRQLPHRVRHPHRSRVDSYRRFSGLLMTGNPLDITAFMGMLIVLSIVINNNILIFDYYRIRRGESETDDDALLDALRTRFRPILMTMMANVFALLPVAFALGAGTQIIQNMAISIMGGLIFAIFVNLYVVPLLMHWWGNTAFITRKRSRKTAL